MAASADDPVTSARPGAPVACSHCGTTAEEPPATWSLDIGARGPQWICEACTRTNLRSIEAKLDDTWW